MSEPIVPVNVETVVVHGRKVVCDGPEGGRHPRVYLTMVDDAAGKPDHVVCPYCSRVFRFGE
ncbi:MAG: zinc-finger domain-containing protein [Pseudomonadaceae bacterium]|nr:zinc-finger domain-containing protein [Pseudomonadaceae bacterium]